MKRNILLITCCLLVHSEIFAQNFSNKGKEFYLCFPNHVPSANVLATLSIWITSDRASSGTITMANGAFTANFNIAANGLQQIQVPHSVAHISNAQSGMVIQKSIKVKVNPGQPAVVAYAQLWGQARSAATLLLPTSVLGKKYRAISFTQDGVDGSGQLARSQFQVIATKPNTLVRVTPRLNGVVGPSFDINLPLAGDMYQYQATEDITGTLIESIASGSNGCFPIAVFSGSSNITFGSATCSGGSYDPLFQQLYPVTTWGKNFGFIPSADYPNGNALRVMASEDNTTVYFNGVLTATLNAGDIYPNAFISNPTLYTGPVNITADKPVCVAQYMPALDCGGGGYGDPDMVILNPVEQNINDITIFSSSQQNITHQFVNILIKTVATPSFTINGVPPTGTWQTFAAMPGYSYLKQIFPGSGSYRLKADSGFNAIAYGFSTNYESYAFSAGTNVIDLYQTVGVSMLYGIEPSPSVCTNSPFKFKISLPYMADSIKWDFTNLPGSPAMVTTIYNNPPSPAVPPDSITVVNGKQIYWYSAPALYTFNTVGSFPVTIFTYAPNPEGCGTEQELNFDLDISDPPVPNISFTTPVCIAETVQFNDITPPGTKPLYKWYWNFGDPGSGATNISPLQNPTHLFSTPGNHTVQFSTITTAGCVTDTLPFVITIPDLPSAAISGATTVCQNSTAPTITFTGSGGTAPYRFTYRINGGPLQTITTTGPSNIATLTVPTTTAGTYTYSLVKVENTASAVCARNQTGTAQVIVKPLPNAAISAPVSSVCQNGPSPNVIFAGATATAPYTFTYTINGGTPQTITTTAGNAVSLPVPTATTGTFNYSITQVQEGSASACINPVTGVTVPVVVRPLPSATITGDANVCQNAPSPNIIFTGSGATAPYTFTYKINSGAAQTISTTSGNSVSLPVSTSSIGTFKYILMSVKEGSPNTCTKTVADTVVITVSRVPSATVSGATTVCLNSTGPVLTFTGSNGIAPYSFAYNINGGPTQVLVSSSASNTATLTVPTSVSGIYNYNLVNVTDASPALCSNNLTAQATVTVKDLPSATLTGTTAVCQNSAQPQLVLTGSGGNAPYKFTYTINGGPVLTAQTTAASNTVTILAPTTTAGTFTYTLTGVTEGSANQCTKSITSANTAVISVNPLPAASISGNASVCQNATAPLITFTGSGASTPYTFTYTINGGAPQTISTTGANTSVTLPVPTTTDGIFNYNLVNVKDGSTTQCVQNQTGLVSIRVWKLPDAAFTWSPITCEKEAISFNGNSSLANAGTITNYSWNFGDPASGTLNDYTSVTATASHTYNAPGNYIVKLTVTTSNGCVSTVKQQTININKNPVAGFIMPEVCLLDAFAQFTDTSHAPEGSIIQQVLWNFGDAANATPANPNTANGPVVQHTYSLVGPYNVQQIVITDKGCKDTLLPLPVLFINSGDPQAHLVSVSGNNYCAYDTVAIKNISTITTGSITRIEIFWDFASAPSVTETDDIPTFNKIYKHKYPEFNVPASKTYQVKMIAYSGSTCFSEETLSITVHAKPKLQFTDVPSVCLTDPAFQIVQAMETTGLPAGSPGAVFSGTGVSATGLFNPMIAGAGNHDIKFSFTTAAGCVDSISKTITVYPMPTVDADRGQEWVMLEGGTLMLDPIVTGNNLSFLWTNNLSISNSFLDNNAIKNPMVKAVDDIVYTLTVTANGNCKASDDVLVKILKAPRIPNTFSPNGDGINDKWVIKYLDTYPECKIKVFTRAGQKVYESIGYKTPWNGTMNGKSLPIDTYYYIIEPGSGRRPYSGYVTIVK